MFQKDAVLRQMAWSMLLEAQVQQSPIEDRTEALMGLRDTLDRFDQLYARKESSFVHGKMPHPFPIPLWLH
jgi:hypothetical protein